MSVHLTCVVPPGVQWAMMAAMRQEMAPGAAAAGESRDDEARDAAEAASIARCRAGDAAAWRRLYDESFPMVFRLAIRMGASEREAADVCQEVFLRVWRGLASFRGEARLRTWLFRITLNEVSRMKRAAAVHRALGAVLQLVGKEEAPGPPRPDRLVEEAEAFAELQAVLARMRPKQRAALVLFEIEELSLEEIAEVERCPLETVRSRLRHARADFDRLCRQRAALRSSASGGQS
jgi:RNA polymerase sigma-70 factor, ECF subfamily